MRVPLHYHVIRGKYVVHGQELTLNDMEYRFLRLIFDLQKSITRNKANKFVTLSYRDAAPLFGTQGDVHTALRMSETINSLSRKIAEAAGITNHYPEFQLMTLNLHKARYELSSALQIKIISQHFPLWLDEHRDPQAPTMWLHGKRILVSREVYELLKALGGSNGQQPASALRIYLQFRNQPEVSAPLSTIMGALKEIAGILHHDSTQIDRVVTITNQGVTLDSAISIEFAGK